MFQSLVGKLETNQAWFYLVQKCSFQSLVGKLETRFVLNEC